jgi:hypothetical protein
LELLKFIISQGPMASIILTTTAFKQNKHHIARNSRVMGMDILRCQTPTMVRKEILMHLIVYNSIRLLMLNAAKQAGVLPRRISFKASVQALRQWEPVLNRNDLEARERQRLMVLLREAIAATMVLSRPGRKEPRCLKRRKKNFQLMTSPRHEMREIPHRGAKRAKQA